jgi:hypothetical protein
MQFRHIQFPVSVIVPAPREVLGSYSRVALKELVRVNRTSHVNLGRLRQTR